MILKQLSKLSLNLIYFLTEMMQNEYQTFTEVPGGNFNEFNCTLACFRSF